MRLLSLTVEQFRSHSSRCFDLSAELLHVFTGPNGSGKTNIIEAIAFLSEVVPCIAPEEDDLVHFGADFARVEARTVEDQGEERTLQVIVQRHPRRQKGCFMNGVRVSIAQMAGVLPVVLFLPQNLDLFTGPPAGRRRFLDAILAQVDPVFRRAVSDYQKALKQRNVLLAQIASGVAAIESLDPWEVLLSLSGSVITAYRLELVETLNCTIRQELLAFGESCDRAAIRYDRRSTSLEQSVLQEELQKMLLSARDRDILLKSTTVGPHRDDWMLFMNDRSLSSFASRGQQRCAMLALLCLEVSYVGLRRGERPVVLLDDVLSELDHAHAERVLTVFSDHQVVMTTAALSEATSGARIWHLGTTEKKISRKGITAER